MSFLYFIENDELCSRKIGVSSIALNRRYDSSWTLVEQFDFQSIDQARYVEKLVLWTIRSKYSLYPVLDSSKIRYGYSETFGYSSRLPNRKVIALIRDASSKLASLQV